MLSAYGRKQGNGGTHALGTSFRSQNFEPPTRAALFLFFIALLAGVRFDSSFGASAFLQPHPNSAQPF
jgi:hypothetical protein